MPASKVSPIGLAMDMDSAVMARLRAPFGCEYISTPGSSSRNPGRWRIHDANDDCIADVSGLEEGYARLIVRALNMAYGLHCSRCGKRLEEHIAYNADKPGKNLCCGTGDGHYFRTGDR